MRPGRLRHALAKGPRAVTVGLVGTMACGLLVAGCATDDASDGATGSSAPGATAATEPPGSTPTPPDQTLDPDMTEPPDETQPPDATGGPTGAAGAALTEQDSGAQVVLAVGEERPLQLGSAWSWAEPVVDGAAVTLTPVDFLVDPGYVEWLVTGAAAGTATLEVVGEPVCGDTTVCPPTTVTLDVEVTD